MPEEQTTTEGEPIAAVETPQMPEKPAPVAFDFGQLAADPKIAREGVWAQYGSTDVEFLIRHLHTPDYFREQALAYIELGTQPELAEPLVDPETPEAKAAEGVRVAEIERRATLLAVARGCVVSWRSKILGDGLIQYGERKLEFSRPHAEQLLTDVYPVYLFVYRRALDASRYRRASEAADTKA